jgi:hypothetical protein
METFMLTASPQERNQDNSLLFESLELKDGVIFRINGHL